MPNWTRNEVTLTGPNAKQIMNQIVHYSSKYKETLFDFNRILPMPEELKEVLSPNEENSKKEKQRLKDKYGADNWYDWCCDNWGTKWNSCETFYEPEENEEHKATVFFNTAWSPPIPVLAELSKQHPEIKVHVRWAEEQWCLYVGEHIFENGMETDLTPEENSLDYKALWMDVQGYDTADNPLVKMEDGTWEYAWDYEDYQTNRIIREYAQEVDTKILGYKLTIKVDDYSGENHETIDKTPQNIKNQLLNEKELIKQMENANEFGGERKSVSLTIDVVGNVNNEEIKKPIFAQLDNVLKNGKIVDYFFNHENNKTLIKTGWGSYEDLSFGLVDSYVAKHNEELLTPEKYDEINRIITNERNEYLNSLGIEERPLSRDEIKRGGR